MQNNGYLAPSCCQQRAGGDNMQNNGYLAPSCQQRAALLCEQGGTGRFTLLKVPCLCTAAPRAGFPLCFLYTAVKAPVHCWGSRSGGA
eukprot:COSAG01_NODE_280_length_19520_cov_9.720406_10_plen_88_part_00